MKKHLLALLFLTSCQSIETPPESGLSFIEPVATPTINVLLSSASTEIAKAPKKGDRGEDVRKLQGALNKKGAKLKVDGVFGKATLAAIVKLQKDNGLPGTGTVGKVTLSLLGLTVKTAKPPPTPTPKPTPTPTPTLPKLAWAGKHADASLWTEHLLEVLPTLGAEMISSVPKDVTDWCPKYQQLDKEQRTLFYAHLISKMAQFESGYKPESFMYECSSKETTYGAEGRWDEARKQWCMKGGHKLDGGYVVSRGLLQMSLESSLGYGCPMTTPQDNHDPYKNLSCAIRVMNRFVPAPRKISGVVRGHGVISGYDEATQRWLGIAAYWSVIRKTKGRESYPSIRAYTNALAICK